MPYAPSIVLAALMLVVMAACRADVPTKAIDGAVADSTTVDVPPGEVEAGSPLVSGEYITGKGWGRLLLKEQGDVLAFSLETITGEDMCDLNGHVRREFGTAKGNDGIDCSVRLSSAPQGIEVAAATPAECKAFCGYNGNFEGLYLRVKNGCGRDDLDRTRDVFRRLHAEKSYKAALVTMSPVLENCLPTLEWEDEGAIRNDLAEVQYENGLYAECLATLDRYAEDAGKEEDVVVDGWAPVLADRYLMIVRAARTTIDLCRAALDKE